MSLLNLSTVINQPAHFHSREISIDRQAANLAVDIQIASVFLFKVFHNNGCTLIKPNNSIVQSLSSIPVNGNYCLSLVSDCETLDIFRSQVIPLTYCLNAFLDICIDFFGVMLTPTWMQGNLSVLPLFDINHFEVMIDHQYS